MVDLYIYFIILISYFKTKKQLLFEQNKNNKSKTIII